MKKLLFISISLLIGILIALISLELFLRLNPKFGYISSSYCVKSNNSLKQLMQRKRYSPLLGFENIPNADGINSYGLVGKEYGLKKDKNTFRILILGDSIGESFDSEFLENQLNENYFLNSRYNLELWNGSVGGYDIRRYYLYLKHKGLRYRPDMIIIFLCLNDFGIDTSVYYIDEKGAMRSCLFVSGLIKRYRPNPFLIQHSHFYRFVFLRLNSYLLNKEEKISGINSEEEIGGYYLRGIKDICKKNGILLSAVIFPYLKPLNEYEDYQVQQYQTVLKMLNGIGINYLDLHKYLPQKDLYKLRAMEEDEIHPVKDKRSHLLVKIICDYLLDNNFKNK